MSHLPEVPTYIRSMVPYVPGKPIEETQREFGLKRVIKLASNENPLGPSPKAVAAIKRAIKELHRYPDGAAFKLKGALAKHLKVDSSELLIGDGSNEIIDLLIRTYCQAGDSIVTSQGAFIAYKLCAQIHGVTTLETALTADLRFDLPAMAKLIKASPRAKVVFIANPNNPTGTYVTLAEMAAFLEATQASRAIIALDYAYWEYVTAQDLPDAVELWRKHADRVVVLRTFSKVYGLAGSRVGYSVASREITSMLEKMRQPFNVNAPGLAGAEAALSDRGFVRKARKVNADGMKAWEKALDTMGVPYWKSQGNFLLVDTQRGFGRSGADTYQACLRRGVIFRPVAGYGLAHALRISVGTAAENKIAIAAFRSECMAARAGHLAGQPGGKPKARAG